MTDKPAERIPFPNRRPCVTVDAVFNGKPVTVAVGLNPITATWTEAFADTARGSDAQHALSDACVLASVALQSGVPIEALERSLGRVSSHVIVDGEVVKTDGPASPVGVALAVVRMVADGAGEPGFFGDEMP
jgi:hypothetical protein